MSNKLRKLLFLALTAWMMLFLITSFFLIKMEESEVKEILSSRLLDCMEALKLSEDTKEIVLKICDEEAMAKCRAIVYMLEQRKGQPITQEMLDKFAESMSIGTYHIFDENGIVVFTNEKTNLGYNLMTKEQSRYFLPALTNPDFELIQASEKNSDGTLSQYIGKARRDQKGLVQVAYSDDYIKKVNAIGNIRENMSLLRIGTNGFVVIAKDNEIIEAENTEIIGTHLIDYGINMLPQEGTFFNFIINGEKYLATFEKFSDYQLIGVIPKSMTRKGIYGFILFSILQGILVIIFGIPLYLHTNKGKS